MYKNRSTKCSSDVAIKVVTSAIMTKITNIEGGRILVRKLLSSERMMKKPIKLFDGSINQTSRKE